MPESKKDTLYYDSDCPICSAEMAKLDRVKAESLELVAIKNANIDPDKKEAFYKELHLQKSTGEMIYGYEANLYAWSKTKYHRLAKAFSMPPLSWMGKLGYAIWLKYYHFRKSRK